MGEAVPTVIFQQIAHKMKAVLQNPPLSTAEINKIVSGRAFNNTEELIEFINKNPLNLPISALSRIAELSNTKRTDNAAFFTSKSLITEMMKNLPVIEKKKVKILEPSVGVGNFIPLIIEKFKDVELDLVDIDADNMEVLNAILGKYNIPENIKIRYIVDDFLLHSFEEMYDYVIGNLPFFKMKSSDKLLSKYKEAAINKETTNICSFFLDKAELIGNYVMLVFPKFLLNTPEFEETRTYISKKAVECIIDFGEKGFPGVLIETIAIFINNMAKPNKTRVFSYPRQIRLLQKQKYILDNKLPYWIIYRNEKFDEELKKLKFDVFTVFRDRQIKNRV